MIGLIRPLIVLPCPFNGLAVQAGAVHHGMLEGDRDLTSLRTEARFQALIAKL